MDEIREIIERKIRRDELRKIINRKLAKRCEKEIEKGFAMLDYLKSSYISQRDRRMHNEIDYLTAKNEELAHIKTQRE